MRVLAVCGFGVGSSMVLRMTLEKAFDKLGVSVTVENTDLSSAKSDTNCDAIFTSIEICEEIKNAVVVPVYPVKKYVDLPEVKTAAQAFLDDLTTN